MRTVSGRSDRVVVVGAGLGGLSAALRLAGAGRTVTVVERAAAPGGRAGRLRLGGFTFDTGPTVVTMPELLADALACVGESLEGRLTLRRLDPAYRAHFADGSTLDVRAGVDATADEIAALCGPGEAAGFRRFALHAERLYRAQQRRFIDRNLDSPLGLLGPDLARLVALGGLGGLHAHVARYVHDDRLRRLLSFQALYAGVSPYEARALYAVIAYLDLIAGVWFPMGGVHEIARALADAAEAHGVTFRYGTEATRIDLAGSRATGVETAAGERIAADAVVVNADLPGVYGTLLPAASAPNRWPRLRHSPSCVVLHLGVRKSYAGSAHHNLHFGAAWRPVFDDLIRDRRLMRDPSLLVTVASRTDPSLAPDGASTFYVLAPTPNLDAKLDWEKLADDYRDEILDVLDRRGYPGLADSIEVEARTTPLDWQALGHSRGTPFSLAHTFSQTGPFRPRNLAPGLENVVFAGAGTHPGVGVPMVLISGRLAAERILGPDPSYRSRAWL